MLLPLVKPRALIGDAEKVILASKFDLKASMEEGAARLRAEQLHKEDVWQGSLEDSVNVLIVEDNPGDAGLISEYLQESRYANVRPMVVGRISQAMEQLATSAYDIVLLDLNLPDSLGLDTVVRINKATKDAAIIVLTGLIDERMGFDAIRNGAQDFLIKGNINSEILERTIRYSIERKKSERLSAALNEINVILNSTLDIRATLGTVLEKSAKSLGGKSAGLVLLENGIWMAEYGYGVPDNMVGRQLEELGVGAPALADDVSGEPIIVEDALLNPEINQELVMKLEARGMLVAPLVIKGTVLGVIAFFFENTIRFNDPQIDFVRKLGTSLSMAMENARLYEAEKSQRTLLQAVTDNVPAAMFIVQGGNFKIKWENPAFVKQLLGAGKTNEKKPSILGDIFHDLESSGISSILQEVILKKQTKLLPEFRYVGSSGEMHWQVGAVPLSQPNGNVDVLVLAVDISDIISARRRIEELARRADEERLRLKAILDTLPVGVNIADDKGIILETNQIMARVWGGKRGMPKGVSDLKTFKGWWADTGMPVRPEQWGLARALQKGETSIGEMIDIQRFDGTRGTILDSAAPIRDEEGKVIGGVSISQDVSHQRQLEQEAVEAKMQAEFYLDILSQDVNAMNANAVGYLELALERLKLEEKNKNLIKKPLDLLRDSSQLIETVNKIQQVESHDTRHGLIDVGWLLEDVKEEFLSNATEGVTIRYTPTIKKMVVGSDLLKDALHNLIDSAIRLSSGKAEVDLYLNKAYDSGLEYYKVIIEDNGPGIPDEAKSKMFVRKQRGSNKATGSGLGLYLVRKVMEDFHGRVWVEDRVPGDHTKGARFVVLLPVAATR